MAKLYVTARSDHRETKTTRTGNQWLAVHARTWGAGVYVKLDAHRDGSVSISIHRTKGSEKKQGDIIENLGDLEVIDVIKVEPEH